MDGCRWRQHGLGIGGVEFFGQMFERAHVPAAGAVLVKGGRRALIIGGARAGGSLRHGNGLVLARGGGLLLALVSFRPVLSRTSTLDDFLDDALEGSDAHASLAMAGERVMPGEAVAARARVGLDAAVDLGVALEVVLTHETLAAVVAAILSVAKMGLDMRLDILLAAEFLIAFRVETSPLAVQGIRAVDEG